MKGEFPYRVREKAGKKRCSEEARAGCSFKELSPVTCLFPLGPTFCFSPSPNNAIILRICQGIHSPWDQGLNNAIVSRNVPQTHSEECLLNLLSICGFFSIFNCILIYSLRIPYNIFWSHIPLLPPFQPLPGCLHHIPPNFRSFKLFLIQPAIIISHHWKM